MRSRSYPRFANYLTMLCCVERMLTSKHFKIILNRNYRCWKFEGQMLNCLSLCPSLPLFLPLSPPPPCHNNSGPKLWLSWILDIQDFNRNAYDYSLLTGHPTHSLDFSMLLVQSASLGRVAWDSDAWSPWTTVPLAYQSMANMTVISFSLTGIWTWTTANYFSFI